MIHLQPDATYKDLFLLPGVQSLTLPQTSGDLIDFDAPVTFGSAKTQPIPTYLNHNGLQSSLCSQDSPAKNCPALQPLHFGEFGQL